MITLWSHEGCVTRSERGRFSKNKTKWFALVRVARCYHKTGCMVYGVWCAHKQQTVRVDLHAISVVINIAFLYIVYDSPRVLNIICLIIMHVSEE